MSGSIYASLPTVFREDLQPLNTSSEKYVKKFFKKTLNDTESRLLTQLKLKPLMVDPIHKVKIKRKNRVTGLSAKQKRELGLCKIPEENQKYENYVPLNKLWNDYMKSLLGLRGQSSLKMKSIENKLLKADYHGALLKVTKSKCSTYIGSCGIVLKETKNMFYIVTQSDKVSGVPKNNNLFEFELEGYTFEIFGNNFRFRPGERSARKFKTRPFLSF
ncbi:ribonuclease P protein subunit p29-like [Rhopilema esculentum]|uniref:ribonuclease P protein subunit p29-like n=1 Tax=Rhopilema esculentum TaxID=499914 RepID=UPI0031DDE994